MSVVFTAKAEIRGSWHDELVQMKAGTFNGVARPASEYRKRYYPAEINEAPCMLRFKDEKLIVPTDFKKGDIVEVQFVACEVEKDVTQVYCVALDRPKK